MDIEGKLVRGKCRSERRRELRSQFPAHPGGNVKFLSEKSVAVWNRHRNKWRRRTERSPESSESLATSSREAEMQHVSLVRRSFRSKSAACQVVGDSDDTSDTDFSVQDSEEWLLSERSRSCSPSQNTKMSLVVFIFISNKITFEWNFQISDMSLKPKVKQLNHFFTWETLFHKNAFFSAF